MVNGTVNNTHDNGRDGVVTMNPETTMNPEPTMDTEPTDGTRPNPRCYLCGRTIFDEYHKFRYNSVRYSSEKARSLEFPNPFGAPEVAHVCQNCAWTGTIRDLIAVFHVGDTRAREAQG